MLDKNITKRWSEVKEELISQLSSLSEQKSDQQDIYLLMAEMLEKGKLKPTEVSIDDTKFNES